MNWLIRRGHAGRAQASVRRRTRQVVTSSPEMLEDRRLLAAGGLGLNVDINNYASFVNLLQYQPNWGDVQGASNAIVLNASGDPESDAAVNFGLQVNESWNGPDPNAVSPDLSGTYNLSFNGQATIVQEIQGWGNAFTVQNQSYNKATNTTTAQIVVPYVYNNNDFFGISFLNTQATPTSPINSGFSNAKLIRPGYAANTTQLYTNQFLAALEPFSTLRYLAPDNANSQPFYNGNTLVTDDASQVDQTGMPWEYLITLANQSNTDMWINIPEGATNGYITALAQEIKSGGTVDGVYYPGLNSNLKIYLEYSNEVWGGIPFNEYYQESAVQNSATNQPLSTFPGNLDVYNNTDGTTTTNVYLASQRRYLEESADIGQIFQSVLGSDPTHQRIRPVIGAGEDDTGYFMTLLPWFEHFFGPASAAFYGLGDADYVNPTDLSSVSSILSTIQSVETSYSVPETTDFSTLATYYGLASLAYEGGVDPLGNQSDQTGQNALAAVRDPAIASLYQQHYDNFFANGGAVAVDFDGPFGIYSPNATYELAEDSDYNDPMASPRFQAASALAAQAPVAATAGTPIAATGATTFSATTDTFGTNFASGNTGTQGYWLVNAASAGTYDLKMDTTTVAQSSGQVELFVDDKQVGGTISVTSGAVTDLGNLPLSAGLNTISILIVEGSYGNTGTDTHFYPATLTLSTPGTVVVGDPSFDELSIGTGNYAYGATGTPWTFSLVTGGGSGLAANGSSFTSANPSPPQGNQVAFIQATGSITQAITGWAAGSYTVAFDAAQRGNNGVTSQEDFELLIDGKVISTFKPTSTSYSPNTSAIFTVTAGTHTIEFLGLDTVGGDNTALIDSVSVATVTPPTSPSVPTIGDTGFEAVPIGAGNYAYNPNGSPWTFSNVSGGGSGLAGNSSAFTSGNPPAPQGNQVAFLQTTGSITQTVAGWAAGTYTIAFDAGQRNFHGVEQEDFELLIDGNVVSTFKPTTTTYSLYTSASFTVTAGTHTIKFLGLDTVGGDNTALIDAVSVATATPPTSPSVPTIGDTGFEAVPIGAGNYAYNPNGSPWTFSNVSGGGSGLAGNSSAFTSGNPPAPQGNQVAFLQTTGSITQTVAGWAAGTYTIAFDAGQRNFHGVEQEDFELLIDGNVVSTFKPTTTTYSLYTSASFTVTAGTHTIEFLGLNTVGGDNTALIDAVSIATSTPPTSPSVPTIGDTGFEAVPIGAGNYAYNPSGSPWNFSNVPGGGSGLAANGSGFTSGNPPAPQGNQVAFLQTIGSITQTVAGWAAGTYSIAFDAAQRGNYGNSREDFELLIDGNVVSTFKPTSTSYSLYTSASFTVTAGTHTIEFLGLNTVGGDNTALIDNVTIA